MKSEYDIGFSGLAEGHYIFNFEIGNTFFEQLDYSEIREGNLSVRLNLEKKTTMMVANFNIEGTVVVMCDRCTDDFKLHIEGDYELIYKFSDLESDDEKIISVSSNDKEINVIQPIYEFITLLLPSRRIHPNEDCNQEMLNAMDDYLLVETESKSDSVNSEDDEKEIDPRWSALKKLKK